MTTPTSPDPAEPNDADDLADRLNEPSGDLTPEPSRQSGLTASERATAQAVRDLSEPERLDGSRGPA